jgi:queuine tRNA-ribosyltransferase
MQNKLQFKIEKQRWKARAWSFVLNGVTVQTPCFMPVWTKGTIKWVPYERMQASYLGTKGDVNIILNNSYHMYLRPGQDIIKQAWWLHRFQHRDKLILTDSGGFQVFSLWLSKTGKSLVKIKDDGVVFRSIHDGSSHQFTPESVVDLQRDFGSDIMMMLDICSPVQDISKQKVASQMAITHQWAARAYAYHMSGYDQHRGVLFPIIQWWLYDDLRGESCAALSPYARDGIAIGGLSVWEPRAEMFAVLDGLEPQLPTDVPRYVMGIGTPEDLIGAIERGIDMFDCVMPTRLGRHGHVFTDEGTLNLKNTRFRDDFTPIDAGCTCHTCRHVTRAYLHHLIKEQEMMAGSLLSLHNIAYLHRLVENIRSQIIDM